jgi:enoyl-CoA hydratase/carnithine racemase
VTSLTNPQRVERARQAKLALDNFLAPAFEVVEIEYAEKMINVAASTDPRAPEIIARLANGVKVARQVRTQIEAMVSDGDDAQHMIDRAKRIEAMTPSQRRLLNIGVT